MNNKLLRTFTIAIIACVTWLGYVLNLIQTILIVGNGIPVMFILKMAGIFFLPLGTTMGFVGLSY